jgi:SanA protein
MFLRRRFLWLSLLILGILLGLTLLANSTIVNASKKYVFNNIHDLPKTKVGLLLGTSKTLKGGGKNDFFYFRIQAAVELYKQGKIKYLLVSGDNSTKGYNEPLDMKEELIKSGVPDSVIFLDYAGFRTFDSVIRARDIFGQAEYIVISQQFHNERAVYLARRNNILAFGYNAVEVQAYKGFKTKMREYLARDKVFIDLLFGVEPKFSGEPVAIP